MYIQTSKNRAIKYMGQKLTQLCGETDNSAMRAGAFNTDRTADRKINN